MMQSGWRTRHRKWMIIASEFTLSGFPHLWIMVPDPLFFPMSDLYCVPPPSPLITGRPIPYPWRRLLSWGTPIHTIEVGDILDAQDVYNIRRDQYPGLLLQDMWPVTLTHTMDCTNILLNIQDPSLTQSVHCAYASEQLQSDLPLRPPLQQYMLRMTVSTWVILRDMQHNAPS